LLRPALVSKAAVLTAGRGVRPLTRLPVPQPTARFGRGPSGQLVLQGTVEVSRQAEDPCVANWPQHRCRAGAGRASLLPSQGTGRGNALLVEAVKCMPHLASLHVRPRSVGRVLAPQLVFHLLALGCHQQPEPFFFPLSAEGPRTLEAVHTQRRQR